MLNLVDIWTGCLLKKEDLQEAKHFLSKYSLNVVTKESVVCFFDLNVNFKMETLKLE